jgi:hypothetical protein
MKNIIYYFIIIPFVSNLIFQDSLSDYSIYTTSSQSVLIAPATPQPKKSASGLFGYVDNSGNFIIEPLFEQASPFDNGIARVRQHGLWGIINEKGNFLLKPKYIELQSFKNQTAIIANPGKSSPTWQYGLIDSQGKELIAPQYHFITPDYQNQLFITGNIVGWENGNQKIRFGVVNRKNITLIPLTFKEIKHTRFRTFAAKNEKNEWQFYNTEGKTIFSGKHIAVGDFDETMAAVKQVSGWGIVLPNGTYATDTIYKNIIRRNATRFDLQTFPQKRAVDASNTVLFAGYHTDLQAAGEDIFIYTKDNKKGLADAKGNLITANIYEDISSFFAGNCFAVSPAGVTILNKLGKPLLPEVYEKALADSITGIIKVSENGRWKAIDKMGKTLTQVQYDEIRLQPYGIMFARQGSQWFLLGHDGKIAGTKTFEQVTDFQSLYSIVKWKSKKGVIDMKGDWAIDPVYDSLQHLSGQMFLGFENSKMLVLNTFLKNQKISADKIETLPGGRYFKITINNKQGVINTRGSQIIATEYDKISDFTKDSVLTIEKDGKKGLINLKGMMMLPPEEGFEEMYMMQEERVAVKIKGKYGFVDKFGGIRIANRYEAVQPFMEGLAAFKLKGKWGFLNLKEEIVLQPQYEQVCNFYKGIACVKKQGKWAFVDKKGKEILRPQYDKITQLPSGKYLTEENNKKGLVSADGKEILHPGFDSVELLPDGRLLVSRNNKWGLLNSNGMELIPVMYDNLQIRGNQIVATIQPPDIGFELK